MLRGSALRLGRDGYLEGCLLARTCRQLSEKHTLLTVFVKAFGNMSILYHVRAQKSNVFLRRTKIFLGCQKTIDKFTDLCLNVTNMDKDFDGKFVLPGVLPESRWLVKTGEDAKADLIPESDV